MKRYKYAHTVARSITILILTVVLSLHVFAQPSFQEYDLYTTRNGLLHNHVLALAQDEQGYIWVGTRNGLCRFDGQEFVSFSVMPDSLRNAFIHAVEFIQCKGNQVWIGTRNGLLACLDSKTGKWRQVKKPQPSTHLGSGIRALLVKNNEVFMGTTDGHLLIVDTNTSACRTIKVSKEAIRSITLSGNDVIVYADKVFRYAGNRLTAVHLNTELPLWPASAVNRDILMINHEKGAYIFYNLLQQKEINRCDKTELKPEQTIIKASGDHFIVTDGNTVTVYNLDGTRKNRINIDENEIRDKWDVTNTAMEDRQGNIWIGIDHGLVKIVQGKYRFSRFQTYSRSRKLSHNYVRSLYADGNTIWVGTWHGYINKISVLPGQQQYSVTSYIFKDKGKEGTMNSITRLRNGTLLAAGPKGLFRLKGNVFELLPLPANPAQLMGDLWMVKEDKRGWVWISSQIKEGNRLYLLDQKKHTLTRFDHAAMIWNMLEDKKGNTWLGTEAGLEQVLIDTLTGALTFKHHSSFALNAPQGLRMWSLAEDPAGRIWIGTTDNGLTCYNPSTRKFTSYTVRDGLPASAVSAIIEYSPRKLWISSTNGLAVMDRYTKKITCYSEEDGVISNDFNFKACAMTSSGELFWGTKMGVMSFFPDSLHSDERYGNIAITNASVMEKEIRPGDSITLLHDENMFTLKFALLEYTHNKHYYRYRLNGFNDAWSYTTERNPSATYTNLPPGTYELQVNAAINPGQWLEQDKKVFITIKPAFWQTSWFKVSVILLLISLMVVIPYNRIKQVVRREQEKRRLAQKISELELSALQAQMNPHFIFNAIHSIQHFIIKRDEINANEYLTKFAGLMRLFLESSKRKFIPLSEELEILRLYTDLEKLRFGDKFDVEIMVAQELDIYKQEIPSMLLQPFVENAIMHGLVYKKSGGLLLIELNATADSLMCIIDDNGIGREASRKLNQSRHSSRGIDLILERVNSYNNLHGSPLCSISITDKTDEHGQASGTRVIITIHHT